MTWKSKIRDSQVWWTPAKHKEEFDSLGWHARQAFIRRHQTGWRMAGTTRIFYILHIDGRGVETVFSVEEKPAAEERAIANHYAELVELGAIEPLPKAPAAAQVEGVRR